MEDFAPIEDPDFASPGTVVGLGVLLVIAIGAGVALVLRLVPLGPNAWSIGAGWVITIGLLLAALGGFWLAWLGARARIKRWHEYAKSLAGEYLDVVEDGAEPSKLLTSALRDALRPDPESEEGESRDR